MDKKICLLYLLIFSIVVMCFLSPVNSFKIQKLDENTVEYNNGKSIITTCIVSDKTLSDSKMKNDLNRINKIVVKVEGKTVKTINKGKGWSKHKYYPLAILDKTIVKGNVKGKNVSILTYDNKNDIITSRSEVIKSVYAMTSKELIKSKHPKNARLSYNQALKIAKGGTDRNVKKVVYRGYHYYKGDLYWSFKSTNTKINKSTIFSVEDLGGAKQLF